MKENKGDEIERERLNAEALKFREANPRKLGICFVADCYLRSFGWRFMLPLFAQLVVLRCEYDFARMGFMITAYSDLFEEVPEGTIGTPYTILCRTEDGVPQFRAVKEDA